MISDMLSKHVGSVKSVLKKWFKINDIQLVQLLVLWYLVCFFYCSPEHRCCQAALDGCKPSMGYTCRDRGHGKKKKIQSILHRTFWLNSCNFVTISQYVCRTSLRVLIVTLSRTKINENKAVVAAQAPQSALQIHVAPLSFRRIHVPRHSRSAAFVCRTTHVSTHSCVAPLTFGGVHVSSHTHFAAFMCHPMTAD